MQTDQLPKSNNEYSTPTQLRAKLGSYLSGVIIGFMLLGMIYYMKHLATQSPQSSDTQQSTPTEMESTP